MLVVQQSAETNLLLTWAYRGIGHTLGLTNSSLLDREAMPISFVALVAQ